MILCTPHALNEVACLAKKKKKRSKINVYVEFACYSLKTTIHQNNNLDASYN